MIEVKCGTGMLIDTDIYFLTPNKCSKFQPDQSTGLKVSQACKKTIKKNKSYQKEQSSTKDKVASISNVIANETHKKARGVGVRLI